MRKTNFLILLNENMKKTLIVVPTYNERECVESLAEKIFSKKLDTELLFVDDNSPDGTGELLDFMAREDSRVHVLHNGGKEGLGHAYIAGFKWALQRDYDLIMEMDADFSHAPRDIGAFLGAAEDFDLVLGSRYRGGIRVINWPLNRLVLSLCAAWYVKIVTGLPFSDPTGGFKCFRRNVLEKIDFEKVHSNGYGFQVELTHQVWMSGFRIGEVPIVFEERQNGESKMHGVIIWEAFFMVWRLLFRSGLRRSPRERRKIC